MANNGQGPACNRYMQLTVDREPYLIRARRCAALTVPYLFREDGADGTQDTPVPWQSFGARCLNNLSSKIAIALFPPGLPFFLHKPSQKAVKALEELDPDTRGKLKAEIAEALSTREQEIVENIAEDGDDVVQQKASRAIVCGGNHCLQFYPDGTLRGIPLWNYVALRDRQGNLLELIIKDPLAWETVPEDVKALAIANGYDPKVNEKTKRSNPIDVFIHCCLDNGEWKVYQEAFGSKVPGSEATYSKEAFPFLPLTMILLDGEHYGRSYVEDYEGDLQTLDGLTQIITTGGAAMARFIQLVRPGGVTSKEALAKAVNGAVITGDEADIGTLQANKNGDYQFVFKLIEELKNDLAKAFLMNSAVQRTGERVTAEEIRYVAKELEDALGGVYANQIVMWQAPYARLKIRALEKSRRVVRLPKDSVKLTIITGSIALGRAAKAQTLKQFLQDLITILGPEAALRYVNANILLSRLASAYGIDVEGLIKSEEAMAEEAQQQQAAMLSDKLAPAIVNQAGQYATSTATAGIKADADLAKAGAPVAQ